LFASQAAAVQDKKQKDARRVDCIGDDPGSCSQSQEQKVVTRLFALGTATAMRKYGEPRTAEIAGKKWPVREKAQLTRRILTP
jgi:hypothetical protein